MSGCRQSCSVSLFYLVGLFNLWSGMRTLLISSVGTYAIAAYVKGPYMPWVGFVFLMGHMSFSHFYRQIVNDPSSVDITGKMFAEFYYYDDSYLQA